MKTFLNRLLVTIYLLVSVIISITAIAYPVALSCNDAPPFWTCWILYPATLIIIANQSRTMKWADSVLRFE